MATPHSRKNFSGRIYMASVPGNCKLPKEVGQIVSFFKKRTHTYTHTLTKTIGPQ